MDGDASGAANAVRVAGLELYRYVLADFMPGAAVCIVLAYYLRQYPEMREIAGDYAFLSEIAGGFFVVGLMFGLALGAGVVVNLVSAMALAWITDAEAVTRVAARLRLRGGFEELEALARQVVGLATARSSVAAVGLDERADGPGRLEEIQTRVGFWLDREHPEDFQRAQRYGGAADLCRSLAGVVLLTWLVEVYRLLSGEGLGVAASWFPLSAAAAAVLLLCSAYANVRRARLVLQAGRQRLHELNLAASQEDTA